MDVCDSSNVDEDYVALDRILHHYLKVLSVCNVEGTNNNIRNTLVIRHSDRIKKK